MRTDRASCHAQRELPLAEALQREGAAGVRAALEEGPAGAARFAAGAGRRSGVVRRAIRTNPEPACGARMAGRECAVGAALAGTTQYSARPRSAAGDAPAPGLPRGPA